MAGDGIYATIKMVTFKHFAYHASRHSFLVDANKKRNLVFVCKSEKEAELQSTHAHTHLLTYVVCSFTQLQKCVPPTSDKAWWLDKLPGTLCSCKAKASSPAEVHTLSGSECSCVGIRSSRSPGGLTWCQRSGRFPLRPLCCAAFKGTNVDF